MRWFKHLTDAADDEKLAAVLTEFGAEGYGVWWLLVEVVGKQMDSSPKCEVTYSRDHFSKKLRISRRKTDRILREFSEKNLIFLETFEEKVTVKIPNMLKHRDEYSKKSGQTPDKLRTKKEKEKEIQKEKEITTTVTVSQITDLYRKYAGVNVVNGGQVVVFQDLIKSFSIETITDAFQAAASANIPVATFLNWCKTRMERKAEEPKEESFDDFLSGLAAKSRAEQETTS